MATKKPTVKAPTPNNPKDQGLTEGIYTVLDTVGKRAMPPMQFPSKETALRWYKSVINSSPVISGNAKDYVLIHLVDFDVFNGVALDIKNEVVICE